MLLDKNGESRSEYLQNFQGVATFIKCWSMVSTLTWVIFS
jgi:hypothetical protein